MRRKKDDKRVLRPGNGNYNKKKNRRSSYKKGNKRSIKDSFMKRNNRPQYSQRKNNNNNHKTNSKTVFLIILILLAFIIGVGAGVLMSFEKDKPVNNTTKIENVTVEMTSNLDNRSDQIIFDESDQIDYNENQSSQILGVEDNPYYNKVEHLY